ncbi:MAG: TrbI/VirB10 family protein [Rhodopila sp.]|nr:TrbI/VirB10 family protein [Rhodopila sp.]
MTPPESPPPKADPASFAMRAQPRAVTRLSRRTLVITTAALTALLFGALWWALGIHPLRLTGGQELYNTDAKPDDALSTLPGSYADLTKPKPTPAPVPQLGPPQAGDLRAPMPQQPGFAMPAGTQPDPTDQEEARERQQAAASAVFFTVAAHGAPAPAPGAPAAGDTDATAAADGAGDVRSLDADTGQNLQDRKQAFLNGKVDTAIYSPQRLQTPRFPNQLMAGTVIAAAMVTGLTSDLPGQVIAQVTGDVYDSVTGQMLLVPQGARLLGKYDSVVAYGQSRVLLIWTRLIMPDGSSIVLDNLPATDTAGYAGLEDGIDYHTWRLLRGVALSSLLGVGSELATNSQTTGTGRGDIIVAIRQSADTSANQAGQRIVSKDLAIQPTLTIRPGFPVRIVVNRDIILKPYRR